jgi:hypothetical protein
VPVVVVQEVQGQPMVEMAWLLLLAQSLQQMGALEAAQDLQQLQAKAELEATQLEERKT